MNFFCRTIVVILCLHAANAKELVRRKRFFNTLWPSEEVKSDISNGLVYAQLPPEYLHLLQGVNDQKIMQRRAGVQVPPQPQQAQQPPRFVHPTRMAVLMHPQYQQHQNQAVIPKAPITNPQQVPRIVMKPFAPNLTPSIALKTREQPLPDIHKNHRFVAPKPMAQLTQKPSQPFNTQQQLPIKKSFENSPAIITSAPLLSVKTAPMSAFYQTKEFQDLLKEYKIKVDVEKLPEITDVMAILGTEDAQETLQGIRNVAESKEGMELIKSYLDSTDHDDDEFYNYDEDVGAGEIQVGGSEDVQSYQAPQQIYPGFDQIYMIPQQVNVPEEFNAPVQPIRATTTGTLTGTGNSGKSWWKPMTWFNSAQSPRTEAQQTNSEILSNVVRVGGVRDNIQYIRNFLTPVSQASVPLNELRRTSFQQPLRFEHSSKIEADTPTMPTVQMTEAQFQHMIKTLKLTPMNGHQAVRTIQRPIEAPQPQLSAAVPTVNKFTSPINVPSIKTDIPLPSTLERRPEEPKSFLVLPEEIPRKENRRNFIPASEPQRAAPYDFIATGRVHQANPDEVLKKSRSLAEMIEGEFNSFPGQP